MLAPVCPSSSCLSHPATSLTSCVIVAEHRRLPIAQMHNRRTAVAVGTEQRQSDWSDRDRVTETERLILHLRSSHAIWPVCVCVYTHTYFICARLTPSGLGQQKTDIGLIPGAARGAGVDADPIPRPRRVGRTSRAAKGLVDRGRVQ